MALYLEIVASSPECMFVFSMNQNFRIQLKKKAPFPSSLPSQKGIISFSQIPAGEKSWVTTSRVLSVSLSSAPLFQLLCRAETTAVLPASSHQAGRASLCSINYAIALSYYAVAAALILWHWGQRLLYSHMELCRSVQISPGGTFPLTLFGPGGNWYFLWGTGRNCSL